MTTLRINLSDDLEACLAARAAEGGFATVEQFAEAVLRATAEGQPGDEELEELLLQRAQDPRPGVPFTPEFAREFREQVQRRRRDSGQVPP